MDIKNIDLSNINHILNCMNLSDVQDVESRIFTESLVRLKDGMIIKQRENSINAPSVGLGCISVNRSIGLLR